MKRCNKCGDMKPLSDFYRMKGMRDGYRNECKKCNLAAKAERYRANPEPAKERARRWAEENPEKRAEWMRRYRASGRKAANNRRSHLKRKFGITVEDYDRMLAEQGGGCAICGAPPPEGSSLHVDHDHQTGRVRGLVCFKHNNALGDFGDDPELLQKATTYLIDHDPEMQEMAALAKERVKQLVASNTRTTLF